MAQSNHGARWSLPMVFLISHTELSILITHFTRFKKKRIIVDYVCNVSVSQSASQLSLKPRGQNSVRQIQAIRIVA